MTFAELKQILMDNNLEKAEGQGYLIMLHNKNMIPSLHADCDAVLMTAGLAYAMDCDKDIEAIVRGAVLHLDRTRAEGGEVV